MCHGYPLKMFNIISPHYVYLQFAGIEGTGEVQESQKLPWMLFDLCRSVLMTERHYCNQITASECSTLSTLIVSLYTVHIGMFWHAVKVTRTPLCNIRCVSLYVPSLSCTESKKRTECRISSSGTILAFLSCCPETTAWRSATIDSTFTTRAVSLKRRQRWTGGWMEKKSFTIWDAGNKESCVSLQYIGSNYWASNISKATQNSPITGYHWSIWWIRSIAFLEC